MRASLQLLPSADGASPMPTAPTSRASGIMRIYIIIMTRAAAPPRHALLPASLQRWLPPQALLSRPHYSSFTDASTGGGGGAPPLRIARTLRIVACSALTTIAATAARHATPTPTCIAARFKNKRCGTAAPVAPAMTNACDAAVTAAAATHAARVCGAGRRRTSENPGRRAKKRRMHLQGRQEARRV
jgi:hypothetical protein